MAEPRPADSALTADPAPFKPAEVLRILRYAGSALYTQAGLHAQLLEVEWAEEKQRLLGLLLATLLGYAGLLGVLWSAGALLLALSWNTPYRGAAALGLIAINGLLALWGWHRFQTLARRGSQSFAASREELAADLAALRSGR